MNSRFVISMSVSIIALAVGFYLLNDINQEQIEKVTQNTLDKQLQESNIRLAKVKDEFYNGRYNGDLEKQEVIDIINSEIAVQKRIYQQYKELPNELKTDKTIDMRFFQLGKYSWAGEESMLRSLENSS